VIALLLSYSAQLLEMWDSHGLPRRKALHPMQTANWGLREHSGPSVLRT
jgi:hypothetical protein